MAQHATRCTFPRCDCPLHASCAAHGLGSGKPYRPITAPADKTNVLAIGVDASRLMEELAAMPCPICPHLIARHSLAGECSDCDCHGCVSVAFIEPDDAEPEWQPRTRPTRPGE